MPAIAENYSNIINGPRKSVDCESVTGELPVSLHISSEPAPERKKGMQTLSELWEVLKNVEAPSVIAAQKKRSSPLP